MDETSYRFGLGKRDSREKAYIEQLEEVYANSPFSNVEKLMNFPMYVPRQDIATFIFKYEIFKKIKMYDLKSIRITTLYSKML